MPKDITEQDVLNAEQRLINRARGRPNKLFGKNPSRLDSQLRPGVGRIEKINFLAELLLKLGTVEDAETKITNQEQAKKEAERLSKFVHNLGEEDINVLLLTVVNSRVQAIAEVIRRFDERVFIPNLENDIKTAQRVESKENGPSNKRSKPNG